MEIVIAVPVADPSQVSETRRIAATLAKERGFSSEELGRVSIVASELATNLIKHGGGGELLLGEFDDASGTGIECISVDKGRGIRDIEASLKDGFSTAGSAGQGLGAIRRQSHAFDIYSQIGTGTAVLARMKTGKLGSPSDTRSAWGAVSVPKIGETACGDGWHVVAFGRGETVMVVDGLGHGSLAAEAALAATRIFEKYSALPLPEIIERTHQGLRPTRGAAVAVARIDRVARIVEFVGVGNIAGSIISSTSVKKMVSHNGTAGHIARKIQAFSYPYEGSGLLVMHSDGIGTAWTMDRYPGLISRHPSLISAVLYRDYNRGRDDATVVTVNGSIA
ncbi:transcriptional regulator [Labrys miyagiensis]|uniref:Transcriptional regulator n=1 Tax=Labrys miyagiensis TaxID=346912 RepID=A0ABQ6CW87_9HYPH|nr:ATP-binding protein [Labrys miyagiensis]GLS22994.1 transcriptional regulator [Labrys miyagiensis]